jgi:hypothetical protein
LEHFLFSGQKFSGFGIMHQEKSGKPDSNVILAWVTPKRAKFLQNHEI